MASHDVCLNWDEASYKYQLVDGIRVCSSIHVARVSPETSLNLFVLLVSLASRSAVAT